MAELSARRRFTPADQQAFARLSGDWNPMHMDPLAARRTPAGQAVVHGVHGVLWALETLAGEGRLDAPPATLRAQFHRFIPVDREVALHLSEPTAAGWRAEILCDGAVATVVTVTPQAMERPALGLDSETPDTPIGKAPLAPSLAEMSGLAGWLRPPDGAGESIRLFPRLCARLTAERVGAMAQASAVVGMACPGEHSIFTGFVADIGREAGARRGLGWRARVPNPRYAKVRLGVEGSGVAGELEAVVRPAPVDPPRMAELEDSVAPDEFSGRRALVIGGSRGLGAASAKLLAAGGANVTITYAVGQVDAAAVVADIRAARGEAPATALRFDVLDAPDQALSERLGQATHIYYFATPRIARQESSVFSAQVLADFNAVYVERFHDLCRRALAAAAERPLSVFYPSSVFVADRPAGMTEYAMAKAAGELLCRDLQRAFPRLAISAPRLPRLLTDQTASILPVSAQDPVAVMLPLLRAERPA